MKTRFLPVLALTAGLLTAALAADHDHDAKSKEPAKSAPRADYPLEVCVVSGDKLEHKPVEYVYKERGKPDRIVLLCCQDCLEEFGNEPAKYLKKIDEAAAAKAKK